MVKKIFWPCFLAIFITWNLPAQKNLTYKDIWGSRQFLANTVSELKSMKDGQSYSDMDTDGNIIRYDFKSGQILDTVMKMAELRKQYASLRISDYQFSNDENKLLLTSESESIYRHSTKAQY